MGFDGRESAQIVLYLIKNTTDDWHVAVSLFGGETPDGEFFDTTNYHVSYAVRNVKRYCNE